MKLTINTPMCIIKLIAEIYSIKFNSEYCKVQKYIDQMNDIIKNKDIDLNDNIHIKLFKKCIEINYPFNESTTFEEMNFAISRISNEIEMEKLRKYVLENLKYVDNTEILKMAYSFSNSKMNKTNNISEDCKNEIIDYDSKLVNRYYLFCHNLDFLHQRIIPESNIEAIVMGILRFGIYLNEALNPLKQYEFIIYKNFSKSNIDKYIPVDDINFCIKYTRNPKWYMDTNWSLCLLNTYTLDQLILFSKQEGFDEYILSNTSLKYDLNNIAKNKYSKRYDEKSLRNFLETCRNNNNIYFEIIPYCNKNKTFAYLTPLNEIQNNKLICYGSCKSGNLEYFSLDELIDFFKSWKMLLDPFTKQILEPHVIFKLKHFLREHRYFDELEEILSLENLKNLIDDKVIKLASEIKGYESEIKNKIYLYFNTIIETAMYMRGWKIENKNTYPLSSIDSCYDRIHENEVFSNSFESNKKAVEILNEIPEHISNSIKTLHLIKFSKFGNSTNIFGFSCKGVVIEIDTYLSECLHNSFYGDIKDNKSCIRTNSNWILFSAQLYNHIFGCDLKINLDKIEEIK